jgi:hypothetical protein
MEPKFVEGNVVADCPDCGVPSSFEFCEPGSGKEFGTITINKTHTFKNTGYGRILYKLMRCTVCNRPGVAKLHTPNQYTQSALESFWPTGIPHERIPEHVPDYIQNELREAELCMSIGAWRASAAMLRSTLEKTLIANGYNDRNLYQKIESAGLDGIITSARRQRAQDLVRTLGNDVLHEEWREVTPAEVEAAHKYVARIIEDFYDDRDTVLKVLTEKGKLPGNKEE